MKWRERAHHWLGWKYLVYTAFGGRWVHFTGVVYVCSIECGGRQGWHTWGGSPLGYGQCVASLEPERGPLLDSRETPYLFGRGVL